MIETHNWVTGNVKDMLIAIESCFTAVTEVLREKIGVESLSIPRMARNIIGRANRRKN